ncbi:MAG: fibrobacter succinogenes major paralogous domain-containing protein [Rikenella sp.]|nr:fibrobacter succinogenes major paralogous domain-containing protein [Rikenella sp.]
MIVPRCLCGFKSRQIYVFSAIRNPGSCYYAAPRLGWTDPKNNSLWQDEVKTLFDPCPAGWRVPRSGSDEESPWYTLTEENTAWNPSEGFRGGRYLPAFPIGSRAWLPAAGLRYYLHTRLDVVNAVGACWPSTRIDDQVFNFYFTQTSIELVTPNYFPNAYPVRCVRE